MLTLGGRHSYHFVVWDTGESYSEGIAQYSTEELAPNCPLGLGGGGSTLPSPQLKLMPLIPQAVGGQGHSKLVNSAMVIL